jgi:hypothetical protein
MREFSGGFGEARERREHVEPRHETEKAEPLKRLPGEDDMDYRFREARHFLEGEPDGEEKDAMLKKIERLQSDFEQSRIDRKPTLSHMQAESLENDVEKIRRLGEEAGIDVTDSLKEKEEQAEAVRRKTSLGTETEAGRRETLSDSGRAEKSVPELGKGGDGGERSGSEATGNVLSNDPAGPDQLDPNSLPQSSINGPEEVRRYQEQERRRIYDEPRKDPAFKKVEEEILHAANLKAQAQNADQATGADSYGSIWNGAYAQEGIRRWKDFADRYPEKARAYADKGHLVLRQELESREKQGQESKASSQEKDNVLSAEEDGGIESLRPAKDEPGERSAEAFEAHFNEAVDEIDLEASGSSRARELSKDLAEGLDKETSVQLASILERAEESQSPKLKEKISDAFAAFLREDGNGAERFGEALKEALPPQARERLASGLDEAFGRMLEAREKTFQKKVEQTETFDGLYELLKQEEFVCDAREEKIHSADDIALVINRVRTSEKDVRDIPEAANLRPHVYYLMRKEKR